MRRFSLVVFPDEAAACRGLHALEALHREGSISLYAAAVVELDETGALSVRKRSRVVPLGGGLGAFVGGSRREPLVLVVRQLAPGAIAMIAEIDEWGRAIDARMEMLGGKVACEWWREVADDALEQRTRRNAERAARRLRPQVAAGARWRRG
jgi:hypothetical protein